MIGLALTKFCSKCGVVTELAKCEIVCANCHRVRTIEGMNT